MPDPAFTHPQALAFAERLQTPLWLFDIERQAMVWANRAALRLWGAAELSELLGRDFARDMSDPVRIRLLNYLETFRRGGTLTESWTLFPNNQPVTVLCHCSGYSLADGRLAMLVEGTELNAIDAPTLRSVEALRHSRVMISVYSDGGVLLTRNPMADSVLGDGAQSLDQHFVDEFDWQTVQEALRHHESCTLDARVQTRRGIRWHNLDIHRTPDPERNGAMLVISEVDITDRQAAQHALEESERRLMEISDVLADGVYVLDTAGDITFCNPAAARLLGRAQQTLLGCNAHETFHHTRADGSVFPQEECPANLAVAEGKTYRSYEDYFFRPDGTRIPVALVSAPIKRKGRLVGSVTAFHDISKRKAAEAALRESERSLANAQRIAHVGSWDWNIGSGKIAWSDEVFRMFGLSKLDTEATYEAFLERVHPDDRPRVVAAVDAALRGGADYDVEHRVRRLDGTERVVHELGEVRFDDKGTALSMSGIVHDITERKRFEIALGTAQQRLAVLIENLRGGVLVEDEHRRIVLVNQAFCDIFRIPLPPAQLIGTDCSAAAEQSKSLFAQPEAFLESVGRLLEHRESVVAEEWAMADGRVFERDYVPVYIGGEYRGHLWQYWEVTERKQAEEELRQLATTDPLTALLNRRSLMEAIGRELNRSHRSGRRAALLLLDLDHFKRVNDTYGHGMGDEVLSRVADTLREVARVSDRAGRIGGEEFLLLLPETDREGACVFAERLREAVAALVFSDGVESFSLTVSIGVTLLADGDREVSPIVARADQALYEAKAGGRNRVAIRLPA